LVREVLMTNLVIPDRVSSSLLEFVTATKRPELIASYLHYVEQLLNLQPVLFVKDKTVYKNVDDGGNQIVRAEVPHKRSGH